MLTSSGEKNERVGDAIRKEKTEERDVNYAAFPELLPGFTPGEP